MGELNDMIDEIKAAGGQVLVFTCESQYYADYAHKKWEITKDVRFTGDPAVSLARYLKGSSLLDVFISVPDEVHEPWTARHPYMCTYTNGCAQPAYLIISKEREVWFTYTTVPDMTNAGGATKRPYLSDIWGEIKRAKLGTGEGANVPGAIDSTALRRQGGGALIPPAVRMIFRMLLVVLIAMVCFKLIPGSN